MPGPVVVALVTSDVSLMLHDLTNSNGVEGWEAHTSPASVKITPTEAVVGQHGATLTCSVPGMQGNFGYHWSTAGTYGRIAADDGHVGTEFDSTSDHVHYILDKRENGKTEQVTVEADLIGNGGTRRRIGTATATLTIVALPFTLEPASATVKAGNSVALAVNGLPTDRGTYTYHWTIDTVPAFGSLTDGLGNPGPPISSASGTVSFKAKLNAPVGATNTVTVGVTLHPSGSQGEAFLGTASATVKAGGAVSLVPESIKVHSEETINFRVTDLPDLYGTLRCRWILSGSPLGSLNGNWVTLVSGPSPYLSFRARKNLTNGDVNVLTVTAYYTPTGGTEIELGSASSTITASTAPQYAYTLLGPQKGEADYFENRIFLAATLNVYTPQNPWTGQDEFPADGSNWNYRYPIDLGYQEPGSSIMIRMTCTNYGGTGPIYLRKAGSDGSTYPLVLVVPRTATIYREGQFVLFAGAIALP